MYSNKLPFDQFEQVSSDEEYSREEEESDNDEDVDADETSSAVSKSLSAMNDEQDDDLDDLQRFANR